MHPVRLELTAEATALQSISGAVQHKMALVFHLWLSRDAVTLCSCVFMLAFHKLKALLTEFTHALLACELLPAATCDAQLMPAIAQ